MTKHRFETLDAMRGVAAIAIVCFHAERFLTPIRMQHAYLAVDFFFALSGLVLVRSYSDRFSSGLSPWRFFKMRVLRFYPLYFAGTCVGVVSVLWPMLRGHTLWPGSFAVAGSLVSAVLLLPSPPLEPSPAHVMPFDPPAWSLFFELAANLLLAAFWRLLTRGMLTALLILSGGVLIAQGTFYGHLGLGSYWSDFAAGVDRTLFSFVLGVWLADFVPQTGAAKRSYKAWLPLVGLTLTFLPSHNVGVWYDLVCVMLVFPMLLCWGASVQPIGAAPFHFLGAISFAIYAIHFPLLFALSNVLYHVPKSWGATTPWVGIIAIGTFVALAWVADKVDGRVRNRLRWIIGTAPSGAL